jgi:broad specificity phosphatase PhoE
LTALFKNLLALKCPQWFHFLENLFRRKVMPITLTDFQVQQIQQAAQQLVNDQSQFDDDTAAAAAAQTALVTAQAQVTTTAAAVATDQTTVSNDLTALQTLLNSIFNPTPPGPSGPPPTPPGPSGPMAMRRRS